MKSVRGHRRAVQGLLAIALFAALFPLNALAENITYTVDPTRSLLTVSGTFAGSPIQAEAGIPGSLTASYAGIISADRDFIADTLQITDASVTAETNGTHSPLGVGFLGTTSYPPTSYAFITGSGFDPSATGSVGAAAKISLTLTTSDILFPESFSASLITPEISIGEFDCASSNPDLVGPYILQPATLALAPGGAGLTDAGGAEALFFPISTDFSTLIGSEPLDLHFSGSVVATAEIPEPSSLLALGLSGAFVFAMNRRRVVCVFDACRREVGLWEAL